MNIKNVGKLLSEYVPGIIIVNSQGVIIWSNDNINNIHSDTKIVGQKFSKVLSFKIQDILNKKEIIRKPSGKKYSIKGCRIIDHNEKYTFIFIEQINNLNNARIKLYCLEKILESINDGVIMSDHKGRLVLYNKAQEELEGLSSDNVLGEYLWDVYKYKAKEMSEHQKVFKTGKPLKNKYKAHAYEDGIPQYVSYNTYPIKKDDEIIAVYSTSRNVTKLQSLLSETIELKRKIYKRKQGNNKLKTNGTNYTFSDIIGNSNKMKNVIKDAEKIALLNSNVLIIGETGTGKEMFAQSIHNISKNKKEPFVAINCAAIPENLLESTLFGSKKGSYTGADNNKGLFEEADSGTLFLDELNSMPVRMQTKLLRVIEEKKVRRVGSVKTIHVDCRIISAINEPPQKLIEEGRLRQDLFYRISGHCLYLPPLREREGDILNLIDYFIVKYNKELNKDINTLSSKTKESLLSYEWPGNVRELEHVIENLMIRAEPDQLELIFEEIPPYIKEKIMKSNALNKLNNKQDSLPDILRSIEKKIILENLNKYNWNKSKTARKLGIIRQSLSYRIKKLGIKEADHK